MPMVAEIVYQEDACGVLRPMKIVLVDPHLFLWEGDQPTHLITPNGNIPLMEGKFLWSPHEVIGAQPPAQAKESSPAS